MNHEELEKRRLAVINLTKEKPFEYRVSELAKWSGLSVTAIRMINELIGLDVKRGPGGRRAYKYRLPKEDIKDYYTCGIMKKDSVRKQIEIILSSKEVYESSI